jgi:hypothetical protein
MTFSTLNYHAWKSIRALIIQFAQNKALLFLFFLFIFSKLLIYFVLEFEFTYYLKGYLVQYLDPELLKTDLVGSIFYLHSQPPLFNFFIGLIENIIPTYAEQFWLIVFLIIGLFTSIYLYKLMLIIGVNKAISVILTSLYMISPSTILYENLFFYTHIIVFLLLISAYSLINFIISRKPAQLILHFSFLSLCSLITGFFHIVWLIGLIFLPYNSLKNERPAILKSAFIPFIIVFALYMKNFILFDNFSASSWFGMNLSKISVHQIPLEERQTLVKENKLSELSVLPPFPSSELLENNNNFIYSNTGVPVLDQINKSSGRTNFNNSLYLGISKKAFKDSKQAIINFPEYYVEGVRKSFEIYFSPPSNYKVLTNNSNKIQNYIRFFNAFIYGHARSTSIGIYSIIIIPLLILFGFLESTVWKKDPGRRIIIYFMLINVLFVMIVGNLFEIGENNRFRYYTEIFYFVLMGMVLTRFRDLVLPFDKSL